MYMFRRDHEESPEESFLRRGLQRIEDLSSKGYPSFLVGGGIRDLLLRRSPRDMDLLTSAPPERIRSLYPGGMLLNASSCPLYILPLGGEISGEITFLSDQSLEDNLAHRDFTINSLALDAKGALWGSGKAREDISRKKLCWNGSPEARLSEDPLRILRLCRFGASLEGCTLAPESLEAGKPFAEACASAAPERIGGEMLRGFQSRNGNFASFLHRAELLLPLAARPLATELPQKFPLFLSSCGRKARTPLCTAAFFLDLLSPSGAPSKKDAVFSLLRRWNWGKKLARHVAELLSAPELGTSETFRKNIEELLINRGFEWMKDCAEILTLLPGREILARELEEELLLWYHRLFSSREKGLLLSGKECMDLLGCSSGPHLGVLLQKMRKKTLFEGFSSRKALEEWLREEYARLYGEGSFRV